MKTKEQFVADYRRRMLGFLCECWALRKIAPTALGMEVDRQLIGIDALLREMYDACQPPNVEVPKVASNGQKARTT